MQKSSKDNSVNMTNNTVIEMYGEKYYEMQETSSLLDHAMIFDLNPKEEKQPGGQQAKLLKSYQVLAKTSNDMDSDFNVVDVGEVNNFNDFKKKLQQFDVNLIESKQNNYTGYYIDDSTTGVKYNTIYLKFNNAYLKLNRNKLNEYCINEIDGKIMIRNTTTQLICIINKNEIEVCKNAILDYDVFKYVYNIKDNKLFLQKDNLDDLELYQYGSLGLKDSDRFYQQTQGYRGNFMRTWNQKQTPKNLLLACMGISNESKDGERTNDCLLNSCCSDDHDIDIINAIKNDIQHEKRYSDYYNYTKSKGRTYQYNILSLPGANQKVYQKK